MLLNFKTIQILLKFIEDDSGNYHQKQIFKNALFPKGLLKDTKIEHYRTMEVSNVIAQNADLSTDLEGIKKPDSLNLLEKPGLVPRRRLELPRLAAYAPQAYLYTIPTPGHVILPVNKQE
jgi:hypothetical protein